jgi:RNA polymerase sigma-70 factor, ECF subfamily
MECGAYDAGADYERQLRTGLTAASSPAAQTPRMATEAAGVCETRSFEDQLVAHLPRLRAFAMSLARTSDQAEDLVQETLLKAWRARDRFEPGTNLQAWLFTILRNAFYSGVTVARRMTQDPDGQHTANLPSSPNQEWRLHYGEMLTALDRLRPHHKEALLLVVAAGMTYEEAASVCECPVNTVKSRVKRARDALAEAIHFDGTLAA